MNRSLDPAWTQGPDCLKDQHCKFWPQSEQGQPQTDCQTLTIGLQPRRVKWIDVGFYLSNLVFLSEKLKGSKTFSPKLTTSVKPIEPVLAQPLRL